jgi:hypothetical protein
MRRLCRDGYLSDSESVVRRWLLVVRKTSKSYSVDSAIKIKIFAADFADIRDSKSKGNKIREDPCKSVAQNWIFIA